MLLFYDSITIRWGDIMGNELFFMENKENEKIDAKLLYVTASKYDNDWHSDLHLHHFTELFYITKGNGLFIAEGKSFPIKENDMVIVNPNVNHTKKSLSSTPLEYIALGIQGVAFSFNDAEDTHTLVNFSPYSDRVLFYLNTLVREAQGTMPYSKNICQNILEIIIIGVLRTADFKMSVDCPTDVNQACVAAKRYIDAHYKENVTLDDLANLTHINKYYLAHVFNNDYKMSPISYLITRRLEESKNLLRITNYAIAEVAAYSGFSSPSYFSQSFKKNTGMRPAEYRQKHKNGKAAESSNI